MMSFDSTTFKWSFLMRRAIHLASLGEGDTSPNPLVGAVVLDKSGKIIGEGYHAKYGEQHAELAAFNNCSEPPEGADLYVNLEPCSIFGKTLFIFYSDGIRNYFIRRFDSIAF